MVEQKVHIPLFYVKVTTENVQQIGFTFVIDVYSIHLPAGG